MTALARTTDPATSVAAGARAASRSTAKEDVLAILRRHGALHDEALVEQHDAYVARGTLARKSPQRLRTARAELVDLGVVREAMDGGHVRTVVLRSGYHSVVWEVTTDA